MLDRLGRCTYRFRWTVIGLWFVLFAVSAVFTPRVSGVLRGGGYSIGSSESERAYTVLNRAYGYRALTFTAVWAGPPPARVRMLELARRFRAATTARFGRTLEVRPPIWTPDRAVIFERIYSAPQEDFGARFAGPLRAMLPQGAIRGYLTGSAAIFHDMEAVSNADLRRLEAVTLPLALVVLLLIFGSAAASALPVLMAPVSVSLALTLVYFLGRRIDMSIFVLNTTSMLGLGIAIDYSLFMVHRFREELAGSGGLDVAVGRTVATSGRAILVSALVVSIGFLGLSFSGVSMLRSIGIGGSIVTLISLLVALTLLPAILAVLGPRINALPVIPRKFTTGRFWQAVAWWVMRRPWPIIVAVVLVVGVLASPAWRLRVGIPGPAILPPSVDSRAGSDVLARHLGAASGSPVLVVIRRMPGTPARTYRSAAFAVLDRICASPQVAGLASVPVPNSPRQIRSCDATLAALQGASARQSAQALATAKRHRVGLVAVFLRSDPSSSAAERYVSGLRVRARLSGYRVLIGGQTAGQMDFNRYLYSRFPLVILFVIITIYILLLLAFRSVLLPLKAVVMNLFSILAAYGAVVFAFQDGNLAGLLGFTRVGNIDSIVPVLLFCVLFGVSTDYEVFLLSRVQEEYLRGASNEESVAAGLAVTGRIITSAAAVMVVVFGAFAFARLVVIQEVGLGLAVAVFVDATLIRALLVPATMRVLGRWNWWLPLRGFPRVGAGDGPWATGKNPAAE